MRPVTSLAIASLLLSGGLAFAADKPTGGANSVVEKPAERALAGLGSARPVTSDVLNQSRATAALQVDRVQINDQDLAAVMTGNTAIGNHTGNNSVAEGSFTNAAGFMTILQNTGNNVLVQNATIINVSVQP